MAKDVTLIQAPNEPTSVQSSDDNPLAVDKEKFTPQDSEATRLEQGTSQLSGKIVEGETGLQSGSRYTQKWNALSLEDGLLLQED
ncbi:hypothetical protein ACH5RR_003188 [Cinchona calisaya]|uniref:Uncharacterized protein n=1 Tax=Cinchona calisaya TaxID=153742 RepID=A0ABD3AU30_9GENT